MTKENKLEFKRVEEKGDKYKRILVKFNPHFLRGSDFEIEFIPLKNSIAIGEVFVTEIDSMSSMDLYRWANRQRCLTSGVGKFERGTIIPTKVNKNMADILKAGWRGGKDVIEPRQIISRVKRMYENLTSTYSEPTAFVINYFLLTGRLGSLPFKNKNFNIERLGYAIEVIRYFSKNASGEAVRRTLVEHLFDTHKTEHIMGAICNFVEHTMIMIEGFAEEVGGEARTKG